MADHRLFVAATPPATIRVALTAAMAGMPGARWQTDEQLHVTRRFIGTVDRHQAEDIAAVLGHVRHPPIMLELGTVGTFDRQGRIDTLWIGIQPRDRIAPLHDKIDRALVQAGVPADARAFRPHVTLARFTRGTAPDQAMASRMTIPPLPTFAIERCALRKPSRCRRRLL